MTYSDATTGIVARLNAERPDVTSSTRLEEGLRPACHIDPVPSGPPVREGAAWRQRVDLNYYPGPDLTDDEALEGADDLRNRLVIRGWAADGWAAGGIIALRCGTLVEPHTLPDLSPREPRALVTLELVYRLPQQGP